MHFVNIKEKHFLPFPEDSQIHIIDFLPLPQLIELCIEDNLFKKTALCVLKTKYDIDFTNNKFDLSGFSNKNLAAIKIAELYFQFIFSVNIINFNIKIFYPLTESSIIADIKKSKQKFLDSRFEDRPANGNTRKLFLDSSGHYFFSVQNSFSKTNKSFNDWLSHLNQTALTDLENVNKDNRDINNFFSRVFWCIRKTNINYFDTPDWQYKFLSFVFSVILSLSVASVGVVLSEQNNVSGANILTGLGCFGFLFTLCYFAPYDYVFYLEKKNHEAYDKNQEEVNLLLNMKFNNQDSDTIDSNSSVSTQYRNIS